MLYGISWLLSYNFNLSISQLYSVNRNLLIMTPFLYVWHPLAPTQTSVQIHEF